MALLVGSLVAMFWKVIFTPAMFFYRDVFNYSYPHAHFIHEACRQGFLPYWNPYLNYGEPVMANPNFLFFYPTTLLIILLPVDFAYTLHYIIHFSLGAVGVYWLARAWGQSRGAALFAAFVFAFSGPVLSLGNFYNHVAAAAWIPWALLLTGRAVESRSRRPWILLVVVFALQFLAAEPFTLLATFGLSAAYAFYRGGTIRPPLASVNRRLLGGFIVVGCVMLALCAVQFLPALDLLSISRRGTGGFPYVEAASWSFHPLALLEVVLPDFFGAPLVSPSLWTAVLNNRNRPYFSSVFLGFVPLFLAFVGWQLGHDRRRNFAAGAALTFLLLSFGRFTPIFALAYLTIPPLHGMRFPVKLLIPTVLLTAILAGWGIDALRQTGTNWSARRMRMLLPLACLLGGVVLLGIVALLVPRWIATPAAWILLRTNEMFARGPAGGISSAQAEGAARLFLAMLKIHLPGLVGFTLGSLVWMLALDRRKVWARAAIPAVALFGITQLLVVNSSANPTAPKSFYTYRPPVLANFQASDLPYRFCYIFHESGSASGTQGIQEYLNFESIPEAADFSPLAQIAFRDRLILARGSMLLKTEGVYNHDLEVSFPTFLYDFWYFALGGNLDPSRADCLLGRTNVRYFISQARRTSAALREVAAIFNGSSQPSYLYENLCVTPRAYAAGSASYSTDPVEALTRLSAPGFDPQREVVLATEPNAAPLVHDPEAAGQVTITDRHLNTVTLHAELSRPGYVVLLDRFDPNWHASVDGREVPVVQANLLFRAVYTAGGTHEVRFYYRQRGLRTGLIISLATLVLLAIVYAREPSATPRIQTSAPSNT